MKNRQMIIEDDRNTKISKIVYGLNPQRIGISVWDSEKGLVYIVIRSTEDILKLKRFFESVEVEEKIE